MTVISEFILSRNMRLLCLDIVSEIYDDFKLYTDIGEGVLPDLLRERKYEFLAEAIHFGREYKYRTELTSNSRENASKTNGGIRSNVRCI
ncbi:hypothetical protein EIM92_22610 [Paenibacillus lentus]|uniref:Uncharacterized protein n=1 Tax=Paenibacillus lentus TaxID=1338368 RepID=A0A3Q8S6J7_9BACL|nr:hypothetical protein EIM92_22610 [Paenibacillus lentus]